MAQRPTTKHDIQRDEENITRLGFDVITNVLVSGSLSMASTGIDPGTGQVVLYAPPASASISSNDWIAGTGTWTCFTTDSPIFNVVVNTNITGTIGLGNRIQVTQSGANKFFLVHGVSITGSNSYLNLYGGTDYTLVSGSLTSPQYSQIKAPFGFPINPLKWSETLSSTSNASQSSPSGTGWYNLGSLSINLPMGVWNGSYRLVMDCVIAAAGNLNGFSTLSTNTFSETNTEWTLGNALVNTAITTARTPHTTPPRVISQAAKTTWFLLGKTNVSGLTTIAFRGDLFQTIVQFTDAYL